jgi:hypothetical protein
MKILNLITTPLAIALFTMIYGIIAHYTGTSQKWVLVGMSLIVISFLIRRLPTWKR